MTWTRKELKERAKQVLRTSYWRAFLVSLLLAFITGGISSCSWKSNSSSHSGVGTSHTPFHWPDYHTDFGDWSAGIAIFVVAILIIVAVFASVTSLAFNIFLVAPFKVGAQQYFKQASQEDEDIRYLLFAFAKGRYLGIVIGMFWTALLNFLWFLLLIIPGIVKSYAYGMVPYILGENPTIGRKRAVQLSNQMTRGFKWRMFVLDLSFIGWFLLGLVALGVGVLFVLPYYNTTRAQLYLALRQQALKEGICSADELNLAM